MVAGEGVEEGEAVFEEDFEMGFGCGGGGR